MRTVLPVSPGEMLEEEFLKPLGLTKYRLAKDIGVPLQPIGDIVAGKRSVRAGIDLRLCRYFGLSVGWWLRGQEKNHQGYTTQHICLWRRPMTSTLIIVDPDIQSGAPVFSGTRVPVQNLFDYLEEGDSLDVFLTQFPSVTREQAVAVLEKARVSLVADAHPA